MWAAALNHEVLNDSVEVEAVVVSTLNQANEVRYCIWCLFIVQLNCNVPGAGLHECLHDDSTERGVKSIRINQLSLTRDTRLNSSTKDGSVGLHTLERILQDNQKRSVVARMQVVLE